MFEGYDANAAREFVFIQMRKDARFQKTGDNELKELVAKMQKGDIAYIENEQQDARMATCFRHSGHLTSSLLGDEVCERVDVDEVGHGGQAQGRVGVLEGEPGAVEQPQSGGDQ